MGSKAKFKKAMGEIDTIKEKLQLLVDIKKENNEQFDKLIDIRTKVLYQTNGMISGLANNLKSKTKISKSDETELKDVIAILQREEIREIIEEGLIEKPGNVRIIRIRKQILRYTSLYIFLKLIDIEQRINITSKKLGELVNSTLRSTLPAKWIDLLYTTEEEGGCIGVIYCRIQSNMEKEIIHKGTEKSKWLLTLFKNIAAYKREMIVLREKSLTEVSEDWCKVDKHGKRCRREGCVYKECNNIPTDNTDTKNGLTMYREKRDEGKP